MPNQQLFSFEYLILLTFQPPILISATRVVSNKAHGGELCNLVPAHLLNLLIYLVLKGTLGNYATPNRTITDRLN